MNEYRTISEAWFNVIQDCFLKGRTYTISRGSYVGQQRKQLDRLAFIVTHPATRPLGFEHNGLPISDDISIEKYFVDYLVNPELRRNEQYTYSSRIAPHFETVAKMLLKTPDTNQATIEVAQPPDILLCDPPCLRLLSWKIINNELQLTSFWRSWDLFAGLPLNLGGLQLLNEMMAEWTAVDIGPQVCYSDGAHLYDHSWSMIELGGRE